MRLIYLVYLQYSRYRASIDLERTEMKRREKIQQELNRRLAEVSWYQDYPLNEQDLAKDFFGRIADYINYIKVNRSLNGFVMSLQTERNKIGIDKDLLKDGNKIITKIQEDFEKIKKIIHSNNVEIKTWDEIITSGSMSGAVSPTVGVFLSYTQIDNFLKNETRYVGDIPSQISEIWSLNGSLEAMIKESDKESLRNISDGYKDLSQKYREKLRLQSNWISFLRFGDYEKLLDVWRYYFDSVNPNEFSSLRLELGEILGEGIRFPSLSLDYSNKLEKKKKEYLLHINRFNNFLIDKLEERIWLEETGYWLWENFGKVVVALCITVVGLFVLKFMGITTPIDILNILLK